MPIKSFPKPRRATEHCRYYSYQMHNLSGGMPGPTCMQGIVLDSPGAALMCMPNPEKLLERACPSRENYTDEEKAAWVIWKKEAFTRMCLVMVEIPSSENKKEDQKYWGKTGSFICPGCNGGAVRWTRAPNNGHIWAACSTPNCFSVIQ